MSKSVRVRNHRAAQFELERRLRNKILSCPPQERGLAVDRAYQELFEKFPNHSRLALTEENKWRRGRMNARLIAPFLKQKAHILEVGCGTGYVITALAEQGHTCYGVKVSQDMLKLCQARGLDVIQGTACSIDFPDDSFDIVFSQELLEHLHPDDVPGHYSEAFRLLKPNGILIVETPNRRTGPQDISRGFTRVAEGLHLKEWSVWELIQMFKKSGYVNARGSLAPQFLARRSRSIHRLFHVPATMIYAQDLILAIVPTLGLRTIVGKMFGLDDIFLYAKKPQS